MTSTVDPVHIRIKRILIIISVLPLYLRFINRLSKTDYARVVSIKDPKITRKFTRPYLSSALTENDKLNILDFHYNFVSNNFSLDRFFKKIAERISVWSLESDSCESRIELCLPGKTVWEGDFCLEYFYGDELLYRMTFTFVPAEVVGVDGYASILIGGSQSYGTSEARRMASKINGEINQSTSVLIAIKGFAVALGISKVLGVKSEFQVDLSGDDFLKGRHSYDSLWENNYGVMRDFFYEMPVWATCPKESEVSGSNKSRTRRKRVCRQAMLDRVISNVANLVDEGNNSSDKGAIQPTFGL